MYQKWKRNERGPRQGMTGKESKGRGGALG